MAMQLATRRVALAVGIIILAVTTVAVISIAKQRGEAARHDEITRIADAKLDQLESETATKDKSDKQSEEAIQTPESSEKPEQVGSVDAPGSTTQGDTSELELPRTGSGNLFLAAPLGAVAFAVASYIQSRRLRL